MGKEPESAVLSSRASLFFAEYGFRAALQSRAAECDERRIILVKNDLFDTRTKLAELADSGVEFDGIVATNDNFAVAANKFARERGLRVPEDLSIVGYDDSELAISAEPEITSIDSKVEILATEAVNSLVEAFEGGTPKKKICITGEIVERETTAFAKGN